MEPIKRILNSHNVKVAQKPFQTLGHIFAKPKDPVMKEQQTNTFYSIPCNDCDNKLKSGFLLQKRKFSFIGAHMPN